MYAAQAWHWVSPETRYVHARSSLRPGGVLAEFWNRPDWDRCALRDQLDAAYAAAAPQLPADAPMRPAGRRDSDAWSRWADDIDGADGLEQPEIRTYTWDQVYSSMEYVRLLQTHSDHILLEPAQAAALYTGVAEAIDRGGGALELTYLTRLCLARATRAEVRAAAPAGGALRRCGLSRRQWLAARSPTRR